MGVLTIEETWENLLKMRAISKGVYKELLGEKPALIECCLHSLDLGGFNFSEQDLTTAVFAGSNLAGVCFYNSNLNGANFVGCNLHGVNFDGAKLFDIDIDTETARYVLGEKRAIPLNLNQIFSIAFGAASHEPDEVERLHVVDKGEREEVLAKKEEFLAICESFPRDFVEPYAEKIGEIRASIAEERAYYAEGKAEIQAQLAELAKEVEVYKRHHENDGVPRRIFFERNAPFPEGSRKRNGIPVEEMSVLTQRCVRNLGSVLEGRTLLN